MKRPTLAVLGLVAAGLLLVQTGDVWARARSGGSRGTRSYSAPSRPSSSPLAPATPTSPSRSLTQPAPPPPPARPGLVRGLMGGLAGFALGGLLGGLLFGGWGGGVGLLDVLLVAGGVLLLVSLFRRRAAGPAYATAGVPGGDGAAPDDASDARGAPAVVEPPADDADVARGLAHIRTMDPGFDPARAADTARRLFGGVQQAIEARDLAVVRDHVTPEMLGVLQGQVDRLREERRTNRLDRIDVRTADVTEAWQESGQDYVTVCLGGSLVDYTLDDATGAVVDGSKTDPQTFEEYWTLTRPVGPNRWKLSAIQTA